MAKQEQTDFEFDLAFESKRVKLTENGKEKYYTIREMNGEGRDTFLTKMGTRIKFDEKGKPIGMQNFEGHQADLLIRCMYDEDDKLVTKALVQSWPAKVQQKLFDVAEKLNALTEGAEKEAKND